MTVSPTVDNSYERSVLALHADPTMHAYMRRNYLDPSLDEAVGRYVESPEFASICAVLRPRIHSRFQLLDLGVGRGLTSLAFASRGIPATCVEYDPSDFTGIGALSKYLRDHSQPLRPIRADGQRLPFAANSFDVVFCRSVLHHLNDLDAGLREIYRVLRPGGLFMAWNEHILSVGSSGTKFLASHPAVRYGVNENAYAIPTYWWKFRASGFRNIRIRGHFLSIADFSIAVRHNSLRGALVRIPVVGEGFVRLLHALHIARRTVWVAEESLPISCIVAEKSGE